MTCEQGHDFTEPVITRSETRSWTLIIGGDTLVMEKAVVFCRRCGLAMAFGWQKKDEDE